MLKFYFFYYDFIIQNLTKIGTSVIAREFNYLIKRRIESLEQLEISKKRGIFHRERKLMK